VPTEIWRSLLGGRKEKEEEEKRRRINLIITEI
jgi:hypothetical protein